MPVTEQQARAITFLAVAARPHGATRWDEAGVFANVMKCADRELSTVTIAVMQAAQDRNAASPGVIPTAGPHWRPPVPGQTPTPLNTYDPATCCDICTRRFDRHGVVPASDHEFVSAHDHLRRRERIDTTATVQALKGIKADATTTEEE